MLNIILLSILLIISNNSDKIKVKDPWMRVSAKGQSSALYMKIENNSEIADTLYKIESKVSEKIEIHEAFQKDDMMGMREVDFVVINPKSTFQLTPRSHQIMLIKLKHDLIKGDEHEFTLHFKKAEAIKVKAKVDEKKVCMQN
jgi:copper(I)-binding protein